MAKSYLIDVDEKKAKAVDIDTSLESLYETLKVGTIDIVSRKVGGRWFDIVCDDEGLLKDNPKPSAVSPEGKVMLVGNLLFFHNDGEGNLTELTEDDIDHLQDYTMFWSGHVFVGGCEFVTF